MSIPNVSGQDIPCRACESSTPVEQAVGIALIAGLALATAYVGNMCLNAWRTETAEVSPPQTWTAILLDAGQAGLVTFLSAIFFEIIVAVAGPLTALAVGIGVIAAIVVHEEWRLGRFRQRV